MCSWPGEFADVFVAIPIFAGDELEQGATLFSQIENLTSP